MNSSPTLIQVNCLKKYFPLTEGVIFQRETGAVRAVDDVSFDIKQGETLGLVGESGCGKTTAGRTIIQLYRPTAGQVIFDGINLGQTQGKELRSLRKHMQMIFQDPFASLNPRWTISRIINEPLRVHTSERGQESIDKVAELLELVQLNEHADKFYMNLSGGLKQKVGIAVALVNDPDIVFLDEPTTGLDPRSRREVWEAVKGLKKEGKTIFLTTHYMEEAEVLADRVAIIAKGQIIARGSPSSLIDEHCRVVYVTIRGGGDGARAVAEKMGMEIDSVDNGNVVVVAPSNEDIINYLNGLKNDGVKYEGMDVRKPNLEAVFLQLTGTSISEGGEE